LRKKIQNFCLPGFRKKFGRRKAGTTNFFLEKSHMFFWGHIKPHKRGGNPFWKEFFDFDKKNSKKIWHRKAGTTELGNERE
jgi:hypothetical protein